MRTRKLKSNFIIELIRAIQPRAVTLACVFFCIIGQFGLAIFCAILYFALFFIRAIIDTYFEKSTEGLKNQNENQNNTV
ncbi:hypothetical protein [Rosettibacter firmus]|uniref:hypothetical protein n=1 Tax=Rosettibacter firmus TaxID=3111522 RepID=UPI00336BBFDC